MALNFAEFRLLSSRMFAIESGKLAKVLRRLWSQRFGSSAKFLAVLKVVCNKRLCQKCFHIDGRAPLRVPLHCLGEVTEGAACQSARVRTLMVAIPRSNNTVVMRVAYRCPRNVGCRQVVVQTYHAGLFADGVVEWPVHCRSYGCGGEMPRRRRNDRGARETVRFRQHACGFFGYTGSCKPTERPWVHPKCRSAICCPLFGASRVFSSSRRQQVPSSLFRRRLGCKRLHHRCVFIHRWFHA